MAWCALGFWVGVRDCSEVKIEAERTGGGYQRLLRPYNHNDRTPRVGLG